MTDYVTAQAVKVPICINRSLHNLINLFIIFRNSISEYLVVSRLCNTAFGLTFKALNFKDVTNGVNSLSNCFCLSFKVEAVLSEARTNKLLGR